MNDHDYILEIKIDPHKYSPEFQRIGRAETIIAALGRALQAAHVELRLAKKAHRDAMREQMVTR